MKTFLSISILLSTLLLSSSTNAQDASYGAFGEASLKISRMSGQNVILTGGRFGWVIDSSIVLGGGIYALASNVKTNIIDPVSGQQVMLGFTCGGVELEYIFFPESRIHASVEMLFAGAGTTYGISNKSVQHTSYYSQNLLLWEPQINVEVNLIYWLHFDAGVSYRICTTPGTLSFYDTGGISLKDLEGYSAIISFKLGSF